MAKGAANKHLQARITYLEKASKYIAQQQFGQGDHAPNNHGKEGNAPTYGLPQLLSSHLRSVSLKSQIRVPREVKHSICRSCDTPLIEPSTSETTIENLSKGKAKPWADVQVVTCKACGTRKRFPIGAEKQLKKKNRPLSATANPSVENLEPEQQSEQIKT